MLISTIATIAKPESSAEVLLEALNVNLKCFNDKKGICKKHQISLSYLWGVGWYGNILGRPWNQKIFYTQHCNKGYLKVS